MKPSGTSPVKSRGILWASPRRFVLRLSTLVKLVSDSILVGFKAGAGLTISMTQLPSLFGVAGGGQNFFERAVLLAGQFDQMNYLVLAVGTIAILLLVFGERLIPGKPAALGVVALAIIAASLFGLPALGAPRRGQFRPACPALLYPNDPSPHSVWFFTAGNTLRSATSGNRTAAAATITSLPTS
jgi:MFS superfamily sulfate permease-like transporter